MNIGLPRPGNIGQVLKSVRPNAARDSGSNACHPGYPQSVGRYDFIYFNDPTNGVSLLEKVVLIGFDDVGNSASELPPLSFDYSILESLHIDGCDLIPINGQSLVPDL
jgi:hypothetical protein